MCGRISLGVQTLPELAERLRAQLPAGEEPPGFRPRYNVAPTQRHWLVRRAEEARLLREARWGFPSTTGKFLINARVETASSRPAFRTAWKERRCVVPADGFFEWTGPSSDRRPVWFHAADGSLLHLAGIFQDPDPEDPASLPRFVVLTTEADEVVAPIHDRMPVILHPDAVDDWLRDPQGHLPPRAPLLAATPVSRRVNSVANDDPSCVAPSEPPRQLRLV